LALSRFCGFVLLLCTNHKNALFWKNKSKFVSLRRILPILSIILLTAIHSEGQTRDIPQQDGPRILKFYPNPAVSFINFEFQQDYDRNMSLVVFNFLGRQVYESKNLNARTTIDLSQYSRGVYIFQLRNPEGKIVESGKFQVAK